MIGPGKNCIVPACLFMILFIVAGCNALDPKPDNIELVPCPPETPVLQDAAGDPIEPPAQPASGDMVGQDVPWRLAAYWQSVAEMWQAGHDACVSELDAGDNHEAKP